MRYASYFRVPKTYFHPEITDMNLQLIPRQPDLPLHALSRRIATVKLSVESLAVCCIAGIGLYLESIRMMANYISGDDVNNDVVLETVEQLITYRSMNSVQSHS